MTLKKPARLAQLLSIELPIFQAPLMQGNTPELVAAISNLGGLGVISGGYMTPEALAFEIKSVKEKCDKPFGVNLFVTSDRAPDSKELERVFKQFVSFASAKELEFNALNMEAWKLSPLDELIDIVISEKVSAVSFAFGIPSESQIQRLQSAGVVIIGHSTHMLEALLWEEKGVDAHFLQGIESGGMRTTFIGDPQSHGQSMNALIAQGNHLLTKPFIVSGGIYSKASFAAAIIQGADGAGIGTAFSLAPESGLSDEQRSLILNSNEYDSVLTDFWTGILGRCISNMGAQELCTLKGKPLKFPEQMFLTHAASLQEQEEFSAEYLPLWASVNAPFYKERSVQEFMHSLVN